MLYVNDGPIKSSVYVIFSPVLISPCLRFPSSWDYRLKPPGPARLFYPELRGFLKIVLFHLGDTRSFACVLSNLRMERERKTRKSVGRGIERCEHLEGRCLRELFLHLVIHNRASRGLLISLPVCTCWIT